MKVYIATSFHDKERAIFVASLLKENGHEITCPWWLSKVPTAEEAIKDIQSIRECDVILGLFEKPFVYKGAIFELGIAYILGKSIIIVGEELDSMVFMLLPEFVQVKSVDKAMKLLKDKVKQDNPV